MPESDGGRGADYAPPPDFETSLQLRNFFDRGVLKASVFCEYNELGVISSSQVQLDLLSMAVRQT